MIDVVSFSVVVGVFLVFDFFSGRCEDEDEDEDEDEPPVDGRFFVPAAADISNQLNSTRIGMGDYIGMGKWRLCLVWRRIECSL